MPREHRQVLGIDAHDDADCLLSQGGSVARRFAGITGWEVRGITRNVESPAALELSKIGVKLVQADLNDMNSLKAAFEGANAIFGVTDFWQFVQHPTTFEIAKSKGITWNEACFLQEVQQGKNIVDAAASVADKGDLECLVFSSLSDVEKASKGKYTWAYHFTGKAAIVRYLQEKAGESPQYRSLFEKTSYVQIGNYLDNWEKNPIFRPTRVYNKPDDIELSMFLLTHLRTTVTEASSSTI